MIDAKLHISYYSVLNKTVGKTTTFVEKYNGYKADSAFNKSAN